MRGSQISRANVIADAQRASHIQSVSDRIQNFLASQIPPNARPSVGICRPQCLRRATCAARRCKAPMARGRQRQQRGKAGGRLVFGRRTFGTLAGGIHPPGRPNSFHGDDEGKRRVYQPRQTRAGICWRFIGRTQLVHRTPPIFPCAGPSRRMDSRPARQRNLPRSRLRGPACCRSKSAGDTQKPAAVKNQDAMKKLARSGSIYDAMNVEFE